MTIEELKARIASVSTDSEVQRLKKKKNGHDYWRKVDALEGDAFMLYAEESGDELLKKAVAEAYFHGERIPWGTRKVIEFVIGSDKVVVDLEGKTMKGPDHIIDAIKEANERWRDIPNPKHQTGSYEDRFMYVPPGDLWNVYALISLIERMYGDDVKVKDIETYPENPLHSLKRELGWEVSTCY